MLNVRVITKFREPVKLVAAGPGLSDFRPGVVAWRNRFEFTCVGLSLQRDGVGCNGC